MNIFSDELRNARIEKNISLADISRLTRINIKFLEAIEQGNFEVLPQTYVRAFLKSYADAVGISAFEILKKYDILVTGKYSGGKHTAAGTHVSTIVPQLQEIIAEEHQPTSTPEEMAKQRQRRSVIIAFSAVIVLIALSWYLFSFIGIGTTQTVHETPFQNVIREQEQAAADTVRKDSTSTIARAVPVPAESLTLRVISSDTTWFRITRDELPVERTFFRANRSKTYKAARRFIVSAGDAGALSIVLNGKELGPLGKKGVAVKSMRVVDDTAVEKR